MCDDSDDGADRAAAAVLSLVWDYGQGFPFLGT